MIRVPQQTASQYKSIRGWGCLYFVYAWFVSIIFDVYFTIEELEFIWLKAIGLGYILDNDLPTDGSKGKWYRTFVINPVEVIKLLADSKGQKAYPAFLYSGAIFEPAEAYVIYSKAELIIGGKKIPSLHFTGKIENVSFNPDIRINLLHTEDIRGWNL